MVPLPFRRYVAALPIVLLAGSPVLGTSALQDVKPADLITVDFLAVAEDGQPIPDLERKDVTFKLDGRTREIRSLRYVRLDARAGASAAPRRRPLPAPFGSNVLAEAGRRIMIVIEHESIRVGKERPAIEALDRLISALGTADMVGLATMPHGRVEVDLTNDHQQVRDVLPRIKGQAPQTQGSQTQAAIDSEKACNSRLTLSTLSGLLEGLSPLEGPKSIIFISSGVMPPRRDALMTQAPGRCELRSENFEQVGAAASLARAHFYVLQPDDLNANVARQAFDDPTSSRFSSADDELAGLQNLAGVTGGELFRLNGPTEPAFARIDRSTSGYYMVGFEPAPSERDGREHRVEVKVARDRVTVRARPHLHIPKGPGATTPQRMLRDSRGYYDVPLRVLAYASRMPGDARLKVVAVAEPLDPSVPLASAAMALVNGKGRLVSQWTAQAGELKESNLTTALVAPAGSYRLRVAAIDANGRRGAADYDIDVALESAGQLQLSGIALGVTTSAGSFAPRFRFRSEPSAAAYLEIYGDPVRATGVSVKLEVAESLEGAALVAAPAPTQDTQEEDRRIAIGSIPLDSLADGDYVVRAVVTSDGRPLGRVYRTLRKGR